MAKEPSESVRLGAIREDLQLLKGAPTITGKPTWMIFDPVQHRYFEIDFEIFEALSLWNRCKTSDELIAMAQNELTRELTLPRVNDIIRFVSQNNLMLEAIDGNWKTFFNRHETRKVSPIAWLIHNYLFIKIPLVRPSRFLKSIYPHVGFLFTRSMMWTMIMIGLAGLYLVSRQWDAFISTFADFMTFEGAITYGITLVFIKILHELGHALMATRFGCRVPTMGVAFLVMFPVLYTDVTDAWKLRSRRKRLLIGAAGLLVELSLASMATFAWAFLPEGGLKSIAFVIATISWIMSVAVNLNPLMRFDGYYLLSDGLGLANLQSRSFAFGRWKLREILFSLGAQPPEMLPVKTIRIMTIYAWAIWVYRFFLFIGIAFLVYAFFFKALGVLLFCIEIVWFIARPLWSEVKEWPAMRKQIFKRSRVYISIAVMAGLGALIVLPVSGRVDVPVIIEPASFERLYPPRSAHLVQVSTTEGQRVEKGQLLFSFQSNEIEQAIKLNRIKIGLLEARLARITADEQDRSQLLPLQQELIALQTDRRGLGQQKQQLQVRAPIAGQVIDLNRELHAGRWVKRSDRLLTVSVGNHFVAKGYIQESDLWRIKKGDQGKFIPDDFMVSQRKLEVSDISLASSSQIDIKPLASVYGGKISSRKADKGEVVPISSAYKITMTFSEMPDDTSKVSRGVAQLEGIPESVAAQIWRQVLRVLVRESGA